MDYWELFIGIGAVIGVLIFLICIGVFMLFVKAYDETEKWGQ
ncbi:hypothetical protein [Mannheimia haemolytica]|uniref:Uncharacterized protein n=1 Tax=Mannheimia haemolytica TaxID=75985 RepID=A0A378NFW7_MANHA|nr:hypothetical protein [Mannheimia haemolytica]AGK02996.1 hypothetical protein MHH_c25620 [Mannheimia haemolytica M42548]AGQ25086.1 hypothetical protein F382_03570 [Mannheimia haemolytica D153]AGQ38340.1 hypothetical protein J450_04055 [Mannheimia haemolytica D171]AGQ40654.1 hypothetical protein J451_03875 [Mannheimia haemolytica D174]AGR75552.1 hypothetical protein N220_09670 [Mannheimia haemolytica USMARC_2286]